MDQIVNPQLWIILWLLEVFWKAFELEVTHGPRPRQSGPQDKEVASALPCF